MTERDMLLARAELERRLEWARNERLAQRTLRPARRPRGLWGLLALLLGLGG